ncbi:hypothetical protein IMSHALPRED_004113 [Imshaugia aleurites]|uniref:Uncharacterized protein n=1 Tax=Imshaugia aleurites TaxID=172621 RepID=A0A8H3EGN3_9LECA|nr:hypothetical protein IMSHALPRED_004113 [Imshaugia aleurites]
MGILSKAERTVNTYTLPSWVPDWRPLPYEGFWQKISDNGYNAAGTSETRVALTGDPNKISLAAKIGDAANLVSSVAPAPDAISLALHTHNASRDAAFGSTLVGSKAVEHGTDPLMGQEVEENIDYPLRYWYFRHFLYRSYSNGVVSGACIPQLQSILGEDMMQGHAMFERDYVSTSLGRRFFTSLGGYMGIGPPCMRPGYLICVFMGGNIPWVAR